MGILRCPYEALEPRLLLATFTVTNTLDEGAGSLRNALGDANATSLPSGEFHTVAFSIPGPGVRSIAPLTPLPELTQPLTIDGTTQPGFTGVPLIELRGQNASPTADGLVSRTATVTRGLTVNRWGGAGLRWYGSGPNVVEGCWIGLNATGQAPAPNGVGVSTTGDDGRIGGETPAQRNVISGNRVGVQIWRDGPLPAVTVPNVVSGNFIGTDFGGSVAVPNAEQGVWILGGASRNVVGGVTPGTGNVISGNPIGVRLSYPAAMHSLYPAPVANRVEGNLIGPSHDGQGLGNTVGVLLEEGVRNTVVGGADPAARNYISGNASAGIRVIQATDTLIHGNWIGTDWHGSGALPNGIGVEVTGGADSRLFTQIGGRLAGEGNVISGNGTGVRLRGRGNSVCGNLIGVRPDGANAVGNGTAIEISADDAGNGIENQVGGALPGEGNVVSGNGRGVFILGPDAGLTFVAGNFIGTDRTGMFEVGNGGPGIHVVDSSDNTIGWRDASDTAARNVISGNETGVEVVGGRKNIVRGNYIGTDAAGATALPNRGDGVALRDAAAPLASDFSEVSDNLVSGNDGDGIVVSGASSTLARIQRNSVGVTAAGGTAALPNRTGLVLDGASNVTVTANIVSGNHTDGIRIIGGGGHAVARNIVGLESPHAGVLLAVPNGRHGISVTQGSSRNEFTGNFLAFNGDAGIRIEDGDQNFIHDGRIYSNGGLGIDLGAPGASPNDALDADGGANKGQNFPVITEMVVVGDDITYVAGTLDAAPGTEVRIDLYTDDDADASGHGEGRTFWMTVGPYHVGPTGRIEWTATIDRTFVEGQWFSATAQSVPGGSSGDVADTSEFSPAVRVPAADTTPPRVEQVYVSSSAWPASFLGRLAEIGLGSERYGYAVPAGEAQLDELPWTNIDRVSVRFNAAVTPGGIRIGGTSGSRLDRYDSDSMTAVFSFDRVSRPARIEVREVGPMHTVDRFGRLLDGEWADGADFYPSGNDAPGGDFVFTVNILPGDVNRDGAVDGADLAAVRARQSAPARYSPAHDVNGDGAVDVRDYSAVRAKQQTALPPPATAAAQAGPSARSAPPRRQLFSATEILG